MFVGGESFRPTDAYNRGVINLAARLGRVRFRGDMRTRVCFDKTHLFVYGSGCTDNVFCQNCISQQIENRAAAAARAVGLGTKANLRAMDGKVDYRSKDYHVSRMVNQKSSRTWQCRSRLWDGCQQRPQAQPRAFIPSGKAQS